MAVIAGTIVACTLVETVPTGFAPRKAYKVIFNIGAHTASTDTATITGVGAYVSGQTDNGRSNTLRGAVCCAPGLDTNSQAVYTGALVVSTDALTFDLTNAAGTAITNTAANGVSLVVVVDEV